MNRWLRLRPLAHGRHAYQDYSARTHDELVRDLNAAHRKLRWEKVKTRLYAGLILASLGSSITALIKAWLTAKMVAQ